MAMSPEEARSGKCACGGKAVLTTRVQRVDETLEYNAFCAACLGDAVVYIQEIKEAA